MNVLHISANYPPLIGGPAASVPYLAEAQSRDGHNVRVVTHGKPKFEMPKGFLIYRCGEAGGEDTGIKSSLIKSVKMGLSARKIIKDERIDIIHVHDPNVSTLAKIIADPFGRVPSVVKYSGDLAWELIGLKKGVVDEEKFWESRITKIVVGIEKILLSQFSKVFVQNEHQKEMLIKVCDTDEEKIAVVPNGIKKYAYGEKEIERAKEKLPGGLKVASACRLVPWKGIENVIWAMKHMEIGTYVIFGDGPDRGRLEKFARERGVMDRVEFFGKVPHEKVQLYLSLCDLLVVPSLYEPFGISILDGFAARIPVVGSNVGGIPGLVDDEYLFDVESPASVLRPLRLILLNLMIYDSKDKKMIRTQTRKLKNYEWPKIAKRMEEVYEEIV